MERKEEVLEYDSSIEGKMEVVIDVSFYRQTKNLRLTMNKKDGEIIWLSLIHISEPTRP